MRSPLLSREVISGSRFVWALALLAVLGASASAQTLDIAGTQKKAEAGDVRAQFELAAAYFQGTGVAKEPVQGIYWLRKSAAQGYVGAEYALGRLYQTGTEAMVVAKDPKEAAAWFRKAAKQNNQAAQDRLSEMLSQGLISKQQADWRAPEPAKEVKEAKKGKTTQFSLAEVETGLSGGITSKRMTTLVSTFGVDFKLSAAARKRLADNGADDNLLNTIAVSQRSF